MAVFFKDFALAGPRNSLQCSGSPAVHVLGGPAPDSGIHSKRLHVAVSGLLVLCLFVFQISPWW